MYIPVNELKESKRGRKNDHRIPDTDFTDEILAFIDYPESALLTE